MPYDSTYNLFLNYCVAERGYAPETLTKLRDCFKNWITPAFSSYEVTSISLLDVLTLRTRMADAGLSVARQYAVLMWVKTLLRFCRTHLHLATLDPAEVKLPRRPEPVVDYLTLSEVASMRRAIPLNTFAGKRLRALVELLLGTGLRIGEALALDRKVFDEHQREISIVGKGRKKRTIFFTAQLYTWVALYLRGRVDTHPALFITTGDEPRRLARADVSKTFIRMRTTAGIDKKLTPHLLRHTYCTTLLNNGVDIRFIKDLAGHQDIQTTARYYLGVDHAKLRQLVDERLNYDPPSSESRAGASDYPNA